MKRYFAGTLALLTLAGCNPPVNPGSPIQKYKYENEQEALQIIKDRDNTIRTVQARADIRLTDSAGKSVELDGAVVLKRPGNLRLRTWKMGQAVLDLTVNGDDAWSWVAREEASDARQLTRSMLINWAQLLLDSANPAHVRDAKMEGERLTTHVVRGDSTLVCNYTRDTLTLVSIQFPDSANKTITLSNYAGFERTIWPMQLSLRGEHGRIDIYFEDVEINGELSPTAFKPPTRAEKLK